MARHNTIEEYVASLPEPQREVAEALRLIIDAPDAGAIWHGHPV